MKNLIIRAIGKPNEDWQRRAIHMYAKRLDAFGGVEIIELPEGHKGSAKPDADRTKKAEAECLQKGIPETGTIIALDEGGKELDSHQFAKKLEVLEPMGPITFLIGGSWGLDLSMKDHADLTLSLGKPTYTHALARVMLLEQIYRAKMINSGKAYHK
ncbi:23S rRNA (pseudouridine(1915)-N(3))-methyltransferase RlmH [Candidatus Uhrbacteria bacterium]|nr:23S rRNA (pseudouridine(1915)-N(3))-methyltransferase RlmH [Candidatus Uhrbacteria bacterium]MBD3283957.1 23S rRNA (pseudouridine(1915)-N(3))-methyltransferase RlmH [Candidatus Uhrbacteria bacterium]